MNFFIIHHGPEEQPLRGAKGGAAIALSPKLANQYKSSSKKQKLARREITISNTTRILSISIMVEIDNPKLNENLTHTISLGTVYFPHSGYKNFKWTNSQMKYPNF